MISQSTTHFILTPFKVPNGHHHGQIEFSTLHTPIRPTSQKNLMSQTSCIPPFPHTQPQIMYVSPPSKFPSFADRP
jgi:hypothetical protein